MDASTKLLGGQCQLIVGNAETPVKTGYKAYGCKVRVDDTQILSVTKVEGDTGIAAVVTNESWENVALKAGIDYISFEDGITSITLNASTDSVMLFLEPYNV